LALALTATTEPALNQPLAGAIEPPADGLAVVVRKYCVVNVAVYVVEDAGAVTECDAAPASDQFAKTYWTPAAPACVAAAIVWVEPAVHCNEQGDVQATLSTVSESPAGELATVMAAALLAKLAVTDVGAFIVTFCGDVVPVKAPEKPEKV
jgi:hypothetical protein